MRLRLIEYSQVLTVRLLEDRHGGGKEKIFEDSELEALLAQDSCQTQEELAELLGRTQQVCQQLLQRKNRKAFLHRIVTGDEKWVHYDKPKRRKSWGMPGHASTSMARPNIHGIKVLLCIWWDQLGVVYYELLKSSKTITEDQYRT